MAVVELCAAEQLVDDGPAPSLYEICQHYEVGYLPPLELGVRKARGVWLGLRWALGESSRPPIQLPIRRPDGTLMGEAEIYAKLVADGKGPAAAWKAAAALVQDSHWLAAIVEQVAARHS